MHRLRPQNIRGILALALLLCFGIFGGESQVADMHERDARSSQPIPADAHGTAGQLSHAPSDSHPPPDDHAVHVCHCAHTHLLTLAAAPGLQPVLRPEPEPVWPSAAALPTIRPAPPSRPPIV